MSSTRWRRDLRRGAVGAGGVGAEDGGRHVGGAAVDERSRTRGAPPGTVRFSPEQVAKILNVTETDVTASLESGDLKGKKIGSQWRVTRAAVTEFMK